MQSKKKLRLLINYPFQFYNNFLSENTAIKNDLFVHDNWAIWRNTQSFESKDYTVVLQEYDDAILDRLNYNVKIQPWLEEGMTQEVLDNARIGFYPGADQITIPHYDVNGRFIGLRGRTLCSEEADKFGKYRPMIINRQLYNHPLGMNLYNLDKVKDNIKVLQKAIIYESEKSTLLHASYFGLENNISVACCGSNISAYQIHMLIAAGAKEIVICFDRQFQELGDKEHKHQIANFRKLHTRYKSSHDNPCHVLFDSYKHLSRLLF